MQSKEWLEDSYNDTDEHTEYQLKKNSKQAKRKWREIEALKEQKRIQREIAFYDSYTMH